MISAIDDNASPLLYPILFPRGTRGYNIHLMKSNSRKVTGREYASHQLQRRPDGPFVPLDYCGNLTQQYIIDIYTRVEQDRLDFIRKNQSKFKVANYKSKKCNK